MLFLSSLPRLRYLFSIILFFEVPIIPVLPCDLAGPRIQDHPCILVDTAYWMDLLTGFREPVGIRLHTSQRMGQAFPDHPFGNDANLRYHLIGVLPERSLDS